MKTKLLTLLTLLCFAVTGAWADNGDVLFSQNFNSATAVAYDAPSSGSKDRLYNSENPLTNLVGTGSNLFTSIASHVKKGDIAINSSTGGNNVDASGRFRVYSNGDNENYWSLNRTSDFATSAPTALKVSMDIWFKNISSGSDTGVSFAIGDGFTDGLVSTSRQSASNVHSGFGIMDNSSATLTAYSDKSTVIATAITQSAWLSFVWVINNTGETLEYDNPTASGTTELNNDCFDIWLKTQAGAVSTYTLVAHNKTATTATKDLQNIYIGYNSSNKKKIEFMLDNIVVTDLTPSSTPSLTGAWTPASGEISVGDPAPTPTFGVTASDESSPVKDTHYTVTYSNPSGTVGLITINNEGASFTLNNNVSGTATLRATLAAIGTDYEVETATYDYTYTVNRVDNSNLDITPATGTYVGKTTVTMTYEEGYTVYYTTDGSDPETNPNSTRLPYTAPFEVTTTTTVKAIPTIAVQGYGNVVERTYTIVAPAAPTFSPAAGAVASGTEIAISSTDDDATIYYTTDGSTPSNSSTEYDAENKPTITDATTIKAISYVNGVASEVAEAAYTIAVPHTWTMVSSAKTWDFTAQTPSWSSDKNCSELDWFVMSDFDGIIYEKVTFTSAFDADALKVKGQYPLRSKSNKYFQNAKMMIDTTVPGTLSFEFSNTGGSNKNRKVVITDVNGTTTGKVDADGTTHRTEDFHVAAGEVTIDGTNNGGIRIYSMTFTPDIPVAISSIGWSTYSNASKALNFANVEDAAAYIVTGANGSALVLEQVEGTVAENTGLLISGTESTTAYIPVAASGATKSTNKLVAGTGASINSSDMYVMVAREGKAAFVHTGDNAATVATGKAYLDLTGTGAKLGQYFIEDGETDGIGAVNGLERMLNDGIYDLQGRKVTRPTRGLYIVNGKKVVIK